MRRGVGTDTNNYPKEDMMIRANVVYCLTFRLFDVEVPMLTFMGVNPLVACSSVLEMASSPTNWTSFSPAVASSATSSPGMVPGATALTCL